MLYVTAGKYRTECSEHDETKTKLQNVLANFNMMMDLVVHKSNDVAQLRAENKELRSCNEFLETPDFKRVIEQEETIRKLNDANTELNGNIDELKNDVVIHLTARLDAQRKLKLRELCDELEVDIVGILTKENEELRAELAGLKLGLETRPGASVILANGQKVTLCFFKKSGDRYAEEQVWVETQE